VCLNLNEENAGAIFGLGLRLKFAIRIMVEVMVYHTLTLKFWLLFDLKLRLGFFQVEPYL